MSKKKTAKRFNPELWAGGSLSLRAWRHLASKCKVQLDAAVWKPQRPHTQNIHDSWAPPVICDITQQAIHSIHGCDDHSRLNEGQTYSVWTNSRGWKSWVTPWLDLQFLAVQTNSSFFIIIYILRIIYTQESRTGLVFIHKPNIPHRKGEIKIMH